MTWLVKTRIYLVQICDVGCVDDRAIKNCLVRSDVKEIVPVVNLPWFSINEGRSKSILAGRRVTHHVSWRRLYERGI
jgi:hypothetical protein